MHALTTSPVEGPEIGIGTQNPQQMMCGTKHAVHLENASHIIDRHPMIDPETSLNNNNNPTALANTKNIVTGLPVPVGHNPLIISKITAPSIAHPHLGQTPPHKNYKTLQDI